MAEILDLNVAPGEALLRSGLSAGVPIVAFLGQRAGWPADSDPVLSLALAKLGGEAGEGWKGLLSRTPEHFDSWLEERFARRAPSSEQVAIADLPISAVFTSSIDPGWSNLFAAGGREPETILIGDPLPPVMRSKRRPPVFFLFGRAGPGPLETRPPNSPKALVLRRLRHSGNMLRNLLEVATPVGIIVVDGYDPVQDWLRAEELLAVLGTAPSGGVLWCGTEPAFAEDDRDIFEQLVSDGIIIRDDRTFAQIASELRAGTEDASTPNWDDPDLVTLPNSKQLVTSPRLRLTTQASALILDDSITGFLPPLQSELAQSAFESFHGIPSNVRARLEGVRRGFAIDRDFEKQLQSRLKQALRQHHRESGALILHGQSGTGKSIALARAALQVRLENAAAVLFATERLPNAADVSAFLAQIDQLEATTLIVVDVHLAPTRFDELLEALRSRGHRVVILGVSYRIEDQVTRGSDRYIEAPRRLEQGEQEKLVALAARYNLSNNLLTNEPYALARFYWQLPGSRRLLAQGLGKEARASQSLIANQGANTKVTRTVTALGLALMQAGYRGDISVIEDVDPQDLDGASSAAKVIDYIMAAARLYKSVPVNLVLRAILKDRVSEGTAFGIDLIHGVFKDQDLFRWHYGDESGEELLVGARLQLEAELICNARLGGPVEEASRLIELISQSYRAGFEGNEETKFVTDIVYALGPDGPFGERYKDSYEDIARALTALREKNGVLSARLMLQEATLRRHYIRTHDLEAADKELVLDEASRAVDHALTLIGQSGTQRLHASRKTRENLWVERAATYGYLATDAAQRNASAEEVWSSYCAAREAGQMASGRVDTYFPLDIALWMPLGVLRNGTQLGELERREIEADIQATLDTIDPSALAPDQEERFQKQRFNLGGVLDDQPLSDEAFRELERLGSTAGYYLRARDLAPSKPESGEIAEKFHVTAAEKARNYLWTHFEKVRSDPRCLRLYLNCEWTVATGRWLFRGTRQPLPTSEETLRRLHLVVTDLLALGEAQMQPRYRYLECVLRWFTGSEAEAIADWRRLASDTEYVERGRVLNRHTVYSEQGEPRIFSGIVERQIGIGRWSVLVPSLRRHVDLVEGRSKGGNIATGQIINGFSISFNYLGPIVDFGAEGA
ncbi:hypothetical protein C7I85_28440 [Mesorhizobium soli]|uniref:Novel STAND NTPase 5 domain-containing protein n=1 Tax=Pseudaminobacter soli (ex Li et al. 2025) TaxID=1295366 RepID=A0A2P7RSE2_9HYPH|nr:hypothetical protein C7I85_28440 [Mesorhizobium soli]